MIPAQTIPAEERPSESLSKIENAKRIFGKLQSEWATSVEQKVRINRDMRRVRVDVEALRKNGKIGASDTYIGVRTIDNNIAKDIPPYIAYLKQSRRIAIFEPTAPGIPPNDVEMLEREFTRVLRYPEWEFEYIRLLDGAELHGWNWIEVAYDVDKPGNCAINHVGTEDLMFDMSVRSIQDSRIVARRYRLTLNRLRDLAQTHGFDERVVDKLAEKLKQATGDDQEAQVCIYKLMYKEAGIVMCGWYSSDCDDRWLRECKPFYNGVDEQQPIMPADPILAMVEPQYQWAPAPETNYPYELLIYRITEDEKITEAQGRGEMDLYLQEAACTIWSAHVNQTYRSSKTMWAPETLADSPGGNAPKQLEMQIKEGAIWDRPMKSFTSTPPDSSVPKTLEMLATQNADNLNQPAWTVNNRQDSRKTATEVQAAQQQNALTNSVSVVLFSVCMRNILIAAWRIVKSQALQGKIPFLVDEQGQSRVDIVIASDYNINAAGDVDFIERQELVQKMQIDWPVFAQTPLAQTFLEEYVRVRYPTMADRWIAQLRAGDMKTQLIQSMGTLLQQAVTDERGQLRPEWQQHATQLQQLGAAAQQALAPAGQ